MPNTFFIYSILIWCHLTDVFVAQLDSEEDQMHQEYIANRALTKKTTHNIEGNTTKGPWGITDTLPTTVKVVYWKKPAVIDAESNHTATIIFLHGYAENGNEWVPEMTRVRQPYMKIICPHANPRLVMINRESVIKRIWFQNGFENIKGIKKSTDYIHALIEKEINEGIPANRIILGGVAQGGALALHAGLTFRLRIGGIVACSTWLPMRNRYHMNTVRNVHRNLPILQCHGNCDPNVPLNLAYVASKTLEKVSNRTTFKTYRGLRDMMSVQEMKDISEYMEKIVPPISNITDSIQMAQ